MANLSNRPSSSCLLLCVSSAVDHRRKSTAPGARSIHTSNEGGRIRHRLQRHFGGLTRWRRMRDFPNQAAQDDECIRCAAGVTADPSTVRSNVTGVASLNTPARRSPLWCSPPHSPRPKSPRRVRLRPGARPLAQRARGALRGLWPPPRCGEWLIDNHVVSREEASRRNRMMGRIGCGNHDEVHDTGAQFIDRAGEIEIGIARVWCATALNDGR